MDKGNTSGWTVGRGRAGVEGGGLGSTGTVCHGLSPGESASNASCGRDGRV